MKRNLDRRTFMTTLATAAAVGAARPARAGPGWRGPQAYGPTMISIAQVESILDGGRHRGAALPERSSAMHTGEILLTFAGVCVGASVIIALLFRFWPRYGSVAAAVERSDHLLEQMEAPSAQH